MFVGLCRNLSESERIEPVLILLTRKLMFFDEPVSRLTIGDELMHRLVPVVRVYRHVLASALSGAIGQKIDRVSVSHFLHLSYLPHS